MKPVYEIVKPNSKSEAQVRASRRPRGTWRRHAGQALIVVLVAFAGLLAFAGWYLRADRAYNMDNLIRLHVVANSDLPSDQEVKLEVRDAILAASSDLFAAQAPEDAIEVVKNNLPLFKSVAETVLEANGFDYPVSVELGTFGFPERTYGPLVLPEGDYEALRVVLGTGKGANWWCILFPPLCYLDVVGGMKETQWGITPSGVLTMDPEDADARGSRVLSLSDLSPAQARELQELLGYALLDADAAEVTGKADDGEGVRFIVSDIPNTDEQELVIVAADTGDDKTEVRFYILDRLRELWQKLALAAPWLAGQVTDTEVQSTAPEK